MRMEEWKPAGYVPARHVQLDLLRRMQTVYPDRLAELLDIEWPTAVAQLSYLEGHGLCDAGLLPNNVGYSWRGCSITVTGLDLLADDGGLGAILGVVTVRLHADTIRDLVAAKIDAAEIPPEKKSRLKASLAKLSSTALQAGVTELAKMGLENSPAALQWIEHLVQGIA